MSHFPLLSSGLRPLATASVLALLGLAPLARAQTGSGWPGMAAIDGVAADFLAANKIPGVTIAASKHGRLVFNKAYGLANMLTGKPMKPDTRCRIGSVSKIITALGVMKLTELYPGFTLEKKLYGPGGVLSEPIWGSLIDYGPLQFFAKEIRVANLLSHTSGITTSGSVNAAAAFFNVDPMDLTYEQAHLHWMLGNTLAFYPSWNHTYANHNLGACTMVIQRTSGMSFHDFIRQHVLDPIGLQAIVPNGANALVDATPHKYSGGFPMVYAGLGASHPLGLAAGGWASSARDLARLMCATDKLPNHSDILQPATIDLMESRPYALTAPTRAHGWQYQAPKGRLWHNGSIGGGAAYVCKFPPGYISSTGIDLSNVNVAVCINIQNASALKPLADAVALAAGAANIPYWYDLFGGKLGG